MTGVSIPGAGLGAGHAIAALCLAATLSLAAASRGSAWREAPPPAVTGGFGEATCHSCHFQAEPDQGAGSLTLAGLPEAVVEGTAYELTLTLFHPGMAVAGFQLSARFADGSQAGAFTVPDAEEGRVGITTEAGISYVHHLLDGTMPAAGAATWTVTWVAPAGARDLRFHAVANAGNDDESPLGDFIYTARFAIP